LWSLPALQPFSGIVTLEVTVSKALATYLKDHMAGAVHAIETLKTMRDRQKNTPLGDFADKLLPQVEQDRQTLKDLAEKAVGESGSTKEVVTWFAEKASRLKLTHESNYSLGTFEALEFLEIGIYGKSALWRALEVAAATHPCLQGIDFKHLVARAEEQRRLVEDRRLGVAPRALQAEAA
jgi:hypothetical protein